MRELEKREIFLEESIKSSLDKTEIYKLQIEKDKVSDEINKKIVDILLFNPD